MTGKKKGCLAASAAVLVFGVILLRWATDRGLDPIIHNVLNPPRRTTEEFIRNGVKVTPQQHGGKGEEVFFEGEGGVRLRGWFMPSYGNLKSSPLVILLHGMGDGCELMLEAGVGLQKAGVNSLSVDHRGFAKSEGSLSFGVHEREDVRRWIEWARREKGIQGPVGIYGGSYGAGVGLQALAVNPEVSCMVALHPFTDLRSLLRSQVKDYIGFGWIPLVTTFAENKFYREIGARGADDVSALSLLEKRDPVPPIFLVHGTADRVIPVEHSRWLSERFPESVEYVEIQGMGHEDPFKKGPPDLNSRIQQFLTRNLSTRTE
ncbi:MAG: alpha/beta fold hydrolase [Candidatus Omnitrophica bacterium]|nr:alpha/beta fold hydrolase [Candidatus Omnitrophota bacterium]